MPRANITPCTRLSSWLSEWACSVQSFSNSELHSTTLASYHGPIVTMVSIYLTQLVHHQQATSEFTIDSALIQDTAAFLCPFIPLPLREPFIQASFPFAICSRKGRPRFQRPIGTTLRLSITTNMLQIGEQNNQTRLCSPSTGSVSET